jgi:hypothetical protein
LMIYLAVPFKRAEGKLYAGFGDERAGLCPRRGTERNG